MTEAVDSPVADGRDGAGGRSGPRHGRARLPEALRARLPELRRAVREAAPALLGYAAVRAFGVLLLMYWGHRRGHPALHRLSTLWDARWYNNIAVHGYEHAIPVLHVGRQTRDGYTNLAFFPLYPALTRVARALTPLTTAHAALLVSWLASLAAAWGVYAVAAHRYGRRTGILAAVLWGVVPHAVVESMAYTETLFTALAAWSLYAVATRRWILAGLLCVPAGLARPSAVALVAAIAAAAAAELVLLHREGRLAEGWLRPCLGALISPVGWLAFVLWVGARLHRWDGYFRVQMVWKSRFDWGHTTAHDFKRLLVHATPMPFGWMVGAGVLFAAMVLFAVSVAHRQPLPLLVYSAGIMAIALGDAAFFSSRPRFLIPAFPLLLPVATGLARVRSAGTRAILLGSATVLSALYGGYLVYVFHSAP